MHEVSSISVGTRPRPNIDTFAHLQIEKEEICASKIRQLQKAGYLDGEDKRRLEHTHYLTRQDLSAALDDKREAHFVSAKGQRKAIAIADFAKQCALDPVLKARSHTTFPG